MTYTAGSTILAADYNGFANTTVSANVNATWNTGYGQTAIATVAATDTVTATQWAGLVNTIASMAAHQPTVITARTAPVTGNTISILSAVNTDITNCFTNRYNATSVGSQFTGWTGTNSKTAATSGASWTISFVNTVTWSSAAAAGYFFNAGGLIKIDVAKSATGALGDPEWNDLATTLCGDIYISGLATAHTIAGVSYTGTTQILGTGTPTTLSLATGFDALVAGAGGTIVYKQFADTAPYTANFIQHTIAKGASSDTLVITTLWSASDGDPISGGTAAVAATPGTAPCTIVTYYPPETTNLSVTWGTPTVAATTT